MAGHTTGPGPAAGRRARALPMALRSAGSCWKTPWARPGDRPEGSPSVRL